MFKKLLVGVMSVAMVLALLYSFGPKETIQKLEGDYPSVPTGALELEDYVASKEDTVKGLKPNNEARIVWADPETKNKTPYAILYIHGFGASQMEGDPVHRKLAEHFGANLYLARLSEHGIKRDNAFEHLTANKLVADAREAFMIAKNLGERVIVVGTSMGGALTLVLASERTDIHAVLLYSPCITEYGNQLDAFFQPWQAYLMEKAMANENGVLLQPREGDKAKYWSEEYHVHAYASLAVLLRSRMTEKTFKMVQQPLFMGYYYQDEENQDKVVSVPAMLQMFDQLGTPEDQKVKKAFPSSCDHVIGSSITSKDWEGVLSASIDFLENKAKVPAIEALQADTGN